MPLGPDVMQITQQPPPNRVHGIVIENAVVTLVTGRQQQSGLTCNTRHVFGLVDTMGHQLLGQHVLARFQGLDCHWRVQMQRQRNNDGFDVRVGEQFLISAGGQPVVDLDLPFGGRLIRPAILLHQTRTHPLRVLARPISVKRAMNVVRPNVGDRLHLDVIGRQRTDQHAPFIAGSNDAHPHRTREPILVAKVVGAQSRASRNHRRGKTPAEKLASRQVTAHRFVEVVASDIFFFGREVHRLFLPGMAEAICGN